MYASYNYYFTMKLPDIQRKSPLQNRDCRNKDNGYKSSDM